MTPHPQSRKSPLPSQPYPTLCRLHLHCLTSLLGALAPPLPTPLPLTANALQAEVCPTPAVEAVDIIRVKDHTEVEHMEEIFSTEDLFRQVSVTYMLVLNSSVPGEIHSLQLVLSTLKPKKYRLKRPCLHVSMGKREECS